MNAPLLLRVSIVKAEEAWARSWAAVTACEGDGAAVTMAAEEEEEDGAQEDMDGG